MRTTGRVRVLEWRWSDEPSSWRHDMTLSPVATDLDEMVLRKNNVSSRSPIPGGKAYQVWRWREINR